MRTLAFGILLAATIAAPAASAAIYQESFDGVDGESLPPPWSESNEFPSGFDEGGCIGASNLRQNGNAMAFVYEAGGCAGSEARYYSLSAQALIPGVVAGSGQPLQLSHSFTVPPAGYSYIVALTPADSASECAMPNGAGLPAAPLACSGGTIAVRISAVGGLPDIEKTGATARTPMAVVVPAAYMVVELGPFFPEGGFVGFYSGISSMPVAAGTTVSFTWNIEDGIAIFAAIPGQEPLVVSTEGGCGACKPAAWTAKRAAADVSGDSYLSVVDARDGFSLQDLGGAGALASSTARFDDFVIDGPTALPPVEVRVAAKGKFKKQPINFKLRTGRVPATVFGSASFNVYAIDPYSVQMGATGGEDTVGAATWSITHVDNDGHLDMIFNFPKSPLATPCGTTNITVTGVASGGGGSEKAGATRTAMVVPGGSQPFFGSDSVRVTGCAAPSASR